MGFKMMVNWMGEFRSMKLVLRLKIIRYLVLKTYPSKFQQALEWNPLMSTRWERSMQYVFFVSSDSIKLFCSTDNLKLMMMKWLWKLKIPGEVSNLRWLTRSSRSFPLNMAMLSLKMEIIKWHRFVQNPQIRFDYLAWSEPIEMIF